MSRLQDIVLIWMMNPWAVRSEAYPPKYRCIYKLHKNRSNWFVQYQRMSRSKLVLLNPDKLKFPLSFYKNFPLTRTF